MCFDWLMISRDVAAAASILTFYTQTEKTNSSPKAPLRSQIQTIKACHIAIGVGKNIAKYRTHVSYPNTIGHIAVEILNVKCQTSVSTV